MLDLAEVRAAFAELADIQPLTDSTGQRVVLTAKRGSDAVVLKLLRASEDPARTQREIEAIARLKSARVPELLDHGKRAIGTVELFYIIERCVAGETLKARLEKTRKPDLAFVIQVGDELLAACSEFEANKIVHRDLKPANLMIDRHGKVWVIDFGIARLLDLPSLTKTANLWGVFTPGYGAPEQIRNFKGQINSRADLYSIGVILYEMLVGGNPYLVGAKDVIEVIRRVLNQDLPIPSDGRDPRGEFGLFVSNMASRFPSRRPQNCREARQWYSDIRKELGI